MKHRHPLTRILAYTLFLGLPVMAVISAVMLPRFLKLETYRPEIISQLQLGIGRRVTVGEIRAHLIPPGMVAEKIVVFEQTPPHRPVLAADRIRFTLRLRTLLSGRLQIQTAAMERPRLLFYTDRLAYASALKPFPSDGRHASSLRFLIHQGTVQLDGPLMGHDIRWSIDNVEAELEGSSRRLTLSARPSFLGPSARLTVVVDPQAKTPIHAELRSATLDSLFDVSGSTRSNLWIGSRLDARAEAAWPVLKDLTLFIDRLTVPSLPGAALRGTLQISTTSVGGNLRFEGLTSTMTVKGRWMDRREGWDATAWVDHYSPELVRLLLPNRWVRSLEGPGMIEARASRRGSEPVQFSLLGSSFRFAGTRLAIPTWSATGNGPKLEVRVKALTPEAAGRVKVRWNKSSADAPGAIRVWVSSVTVKDVFDVFTLRPSTPIGIEPWIIQKGEYAGQVEKKGRVTVDLAHLTFQDLILKTTGQVDISTAPAQSHFGGTFSNVRLSPVIESFGVHPAPITGWADVDFAVDFPFESHWIDKIQGRAACQSREGRIRAGKVVYRIANVLNLNHLFNPAERSSTTKAGLPYETASGTATISHGILQSQDIRILAESIAIAANGQINIPAHTIDARVELQLMNTIKDTISAIPLVKLVVSPNTGLIQIPVKIRGHLDNPEID